MWRFLLPGSAIAVALMVMLAEGLTGLQSYPYSSRQVISTFSSANLQPSSGTVGLTEKQPGREAVQDDIADPQRQPQVAQLGQDPEQTRTVTNKPHDPDLDGQMTNALQASKALQEQDEQPSFEPDASRTNALWHEVGKVHQRQMQQTALGRRKRMAAAIRPRARTYTSVYITRRNHGTWLFPPQEAGGER